MCKLAAIDTNGKKVKAADIKARHMQNIINAAKAFDKIDMVILFGSAMTSGCTAESDTDIAIFGKVPKTKMLRYAKYTKFMDAVYDYMPDGEHFRNMIS